MTTLTSMAAEDQSKKQINTTSDPMRNGVRFPLRLKIRVETDEGAFDAETEDVSASGMQLRTSVPAPPVNTRLMWTMVLPRESTGAPEDTVVYCIGRVIWKNSGNGSYQTGVVIDSYRFAGGAQ